MGRRNDHSRDEIKTMILDEARAIICAEGSAGLKVRRIMQATGYATGTFYNLFSSLNALILQINAQTLEDLIQEMQAEMDECPKDQVAVEVLALAYIRYGREHLPLWDLLFNFQLPPHAELPDWYVEKIDRAFQLIERALLQDIEIPTATLHRSARVLWASLHGIATLALRGKLATTLTESTEILCAELLTHYLEGLRKNTNSKP